MILKEQIASYNCLIKNLFELNKRISEIYNKSFDVNRLMSDEKYLEEIEIVHATIFAEFGPDYNKSFQEFQSIIYLLPADVIDNTMGYYNCLGNLFESDSDPDLGIKILTEPNLKVFEVINVIRQHLAFDDLSKAT